jgi:hypothetical protein
VVTWRSGQYERPKYEWIVGRCKFSVPGVTQKQVNALGLVTQASYGRLLSRPDRTLGRENTKMHGIAYCRMSPYPEPAGHFELSLIWRHALW